MAQRALRVTPAFLCSLLILFKHTNIPSPLQCQGEEVTKELPHCLINYPKHFQGSILTATDVLGVWASPFSGGQAWLFASQMSCYSFRSQQSSVRTYMCVATRWFSGQTSPPPCWCSVLLAAEHPWPHGRVARQVTRFACVDLLELKDMFEPDEIVWCLSKKPACQAASRLGGGARGG